MTDPGNTIRERTTLKGSPLFLLYILAEPEAPPVPEIAEMMGLCERQVKRLIQQLEEAGEVRVERGKGRGHSSKYVVTCLEKVARKGDIKGDTQSTAKPPRTAQTAEIKGDIKGDAVEVINSDIPSPMSPFRPEIKGDIVPPSLDIRTLNKKHSREGSNEPSAPERGGYTLQGYIGKLIQFREGEIGTKLPNHKMEAAAAKWLFQQDWDVGEVVACYHALKRQKWRGTPVTLNTVMSHIADWKQGSLNDERNTQQSKPSRADTARGRQYAPFRGAEGGGDDGDDSRPLPILAGVAAPSRRRS